MLYQVPSEERSISLTYFGGAARSKTINSKKVRQDRLGSQSRAINRAYFEPVFFEVLADSLSKFRTSGLGFDARLVAIGAAAAGLVMPLLLGVLVAAQSAEISTRTHFFVKKKLHLMSKKPERELKSGRILIEAN